MVDCPSLQILLSYLPDAPGKIKKTPEFNEKSHGFGLRNLVDFRLNNTTAANR
jgi:hypothetical protein